MASVILVIYALLLRFWTLVYIDEWEPQSAGVLAKWVYDMVGTKGWLPDSLAILLVFVQAWMLNALVLRDRLGRDANLFAGVFFILICSALPPFLHLSPLHMANFFYILAVYELFSIYKKPSCTVNLFNAGLWIALGSFFYPSYFVLLLLAIIAINTLRSLRIQDILVVLAGAFVPYLYLGVYYFWTNRLSSFFGEQFPLQFGWPDLSVPSPLLYYISIVFFVILCLIVLFSWSNFLMKHIIQVQKKINILFAGIFVALLGPFLVPVLTIDFLLFLAVPLGVLISFNFTNMPRQMAEVVHVVVLISIFYLQYLSFHNFM